MVNLQAEEGDAAMIRFFGLYLMTENELMELDEKWLAMLPEIQKNRQAGMIAHEAPGKWEYRALPSPVNPDRELKK
jgi:hypothetical protein